MTTRFLPLTAGDPTEVAGYVLRARLGSGGMGTVYLSFSRGGRPVAIKLIRQDLADDPDFRRRFTREILAAQQVQGHYTAPVVDADPDAPVPWFASSYIAGPSLQRAVAECGPFPVFTVFRLVAGAAEGVAAVHAVGLVHRDLKPANVLLAQDGPRVIDFGIAYSANAAALTGRGAIGTPGYMAPEQVRGQVGPATDVFGLGQLALYAATGHPAFGEGDPDLLLYRIMNEQPYLDDCPEPLWPLVQRCLAKDPGSRPHVNEVMDFARRAMHGDTMRILNEPWLPPRVAATLQDYAPSAAPSRSPSRPLPATGPALRRPAAALAEPTTVEVAPRRRPPSRGLAVAIVAVLVLLGAVGFGGYQWGKTSTSAGAGTSGSTGQSSTTPELSGPVGSSTYHEEWSASFHIPTVCAAGDRSPTAVTFFSDAHPFPYQISTGTAENQPGVDLDVMCNVGGETLSFENVPTLPEAAGTSGAVCHTQMNKDTPAQESQKAINLATLNKAETFCMSFDGAQVAMVTIGSNSAASIPSLSLSVTYWNTPPGTPATAAASS